MCFTFSVTVLSRVTNNKKYRQPVTPLYIALESERTMLRGLTSSQGHGRHTLVFLMNVSTIHGAAFILLMHTYDRVATNVS
jgi:hypothetical protein